MSWSTFVVGHVKFHEWVPEKIKQKVLEEIEGAVETKPEWNPRDCDYEFEEVSWSSHVDDKDIEKVYQKYRPLFEIFACSLYYLDDPDADFYTEQRYASLDEMLRKAIAKIEENDATLDMVQGLLEIIPDLLEDGVKLDADLIKKLLEAITPFLKDVDQDAVKRFLGAISAHYYNDKSIMAAILSIAC